MKNTTPTSHGDDTETDSHDTSSRHSSSANDGDRGEECTKVSMNEPPSGESPGAALMKRAVLAMLFCVLTDAMNVQCTAANHPLMVLPGAHPDSFPDTEPFEFATAQYMINTALASGAFFANLGAGWLSDHVGRRRMVLINMSGSVIFTIAKYLARHDYWTFVSMAFVNGCFSSTPALGLGYMAELFMHDRVAADARMGHVMAIMIVGRSAGGLLAVITPDDLFFPLIIASAISLFGFIMGYFYLPEPRDCLEQLQLEKDEINTNQSIDKDDNDRMKTPAIESFDKVTLFNVIFGSLIDNAGSQGLVPLALSPLMFETFHFDFVEQGLDPIMSEQAYRWLYSMVAMAAIPGALCTPWIFKKFGVACSCVIFNLLTGCVIISLLYIALIEPTRATYSCFTSLLYVGFSMTIVSQMSTGPMLDRITPLEKKGFVQGITGAIFDGCSAVFPFVYGMIVDNYGISVTMWISFGISCLAGLVNLPLVVHPRLKRDVLEEKGTEEEVIDFTKRTTVSSLYLLEDGGDDDDGEFSC